MSLEAEVLDDHREDERGSQVIKKEGAIRSIKNGVFEIKKPTLLEKGEEIDTNPSSVVP